MTNRLEERLRAAFDAADHLVVEPSRVESQVRRPVGVRSGVVVAAASAALVVVVVGGVALLRSDASGDVPGEAGVPTASTPAVTSTAVTSTAVTSTTVAAPPSGTRATIQVVEDGDHGSAAPRAITASGDGFVALIEDPTGVWAWGSADGLQWTRLGNLPVESESGLALGFAGPVEVVQYDGELIAAGTIHGQTTANNTQGTRTAAVWRSSDDGATWSLETVGTGFIGSVTETADGPIAAGAMVRGPGSRAALWRLTDSSSEAIDLASAVGTEADVSFVRALTDTDLGYIAYVSTGTLAEADKADRVFAWISQDGSTWSDADELQPFGHGPMAVWRTPQGYFAQAYERAALESSFNLWSSPDGLTWSPVDLGVESYEIQDLAHTGILFAVGKTQTMENGAQAAFWSSNSGIQWDTVRPLDDPSSVEPWVAGESEDRIVILGWSRPPNGVVTAWIFN